jgi:hypothetical protein
MRRAVPKDEKRLRNLNYTNIVRMQEKKMNARQLTLSCKTLSNAWITRVECHHSGSLIVSATAAVSPLCFA